MARYWPVTSKGKYHRARQRSSRGKKTHGKKFRTKAGVWGCYVYVNGKRVGFERR